MTTIPVVVNTGMGTTLQPIVIYFVGEKEGGGEGGRDETRERNSSDEVEIHQQYA